MCRRVSLLGRQSHGVAGLLLVSPLFLHCGVITAQSMQQNNLREIVYGKHTNGLDLSGVGKGQSHGVSLIDQGPRSAHVIANKDSVLLKVSPVAFEKLLHEARALPVTFLLSLSRSVVGRMRSLIRNYEDSVRFIRAIQRAR